MIRISAFIAAILLTTTALRAQDETFEPAEKKTKTDAEVYQEKLVKEYRYNKVMLIPYRPDMHLSDADPELCRATGKKVSEIHNRFRLELDYGLTGKIMPLYKVKPMLRAQTKEDISELNRIYGSVNYRYDKSKPLDYYDILDEKKPLKERVAEKVALKSEKNKESTTTDYIEELYIKSFEEDVDYMNVQISDDSLLSHLHQEYETDLFLFVNQFEIKTHSKSCYDLQNHNYERELRVHFSVFDKEGKQISGGIAIAVLNSNSNNLDEIITKTFPYLTDEIIDQMPSPEKTVAQIQQIKMKQFRKEVKKKAKEARKKAREEQTETEVSNLD